MRVLSCYHDTVLRRSVARVTLCVDIRQMCLDIHVYIYIYTYMYICKTYLFMYLFASAMYIYIYVYVCGKDLKDLLVIGWNKEAANSLLSEVVVRRSQCRFGLHLCHRHACFFARCFDCFSQIFSLSRLFLADCPKHFDPKNLNPITPNHKKPACIPHPHYESHDRIGYAPETRS